jgi:hypothetical protein
MGGRARTECTQRCPSSARLKAPNLMGHSAHFTLRAPPSSGLCSSCTLRGRISACRKQTDIDTDTDKQGGEQGSWVLVQQRLASSSARQCCIAASQKGPTAVQGKPGSNTIKQTSRKQHYLQQRSPAALPASAGFPRSPCRARTATRPLAQQKCRSTAGALPRRIARRTLSRWGALQAGAGRQDSGRERGGAIIET